MSVSEEIRVVGFSPSLAADFARLNYEWIDRYFEIEPHDIELLDSPYENIIEHGGQIFFAMVNETPAGTAAMIRIDAHRFELAKMAVSPDFQGKGIANLLMDACIEFARSNSARTIFLETNAKLTAAMGLYRKYGFVETPLDPDSFYTRVNVRMELAINQSNM